MALIQKANTTVTDKFGNEYSSVYLCLDVRYGSKELKEQTIYVFKYKDKAARDSHAVEPFETITYSVGGTKWDEFFSVAAIRAGGDQYAQAYAYIKQLVEQVQTGVDAENMPIYEDVLVYANFEDLL